MTAIQRNPLRIPAAMLGLLLAAAASGAGAQAREARLRPPAQVDCPRDHLTVYAGQVLTYRRDLGRTVMEIRTDWGTRERVVLTHPGSDDPARWFLLAGAPFGADDWPRIESDRGRLRDGMRAAAWVCDDGRPPRVDWQPPHER